jgi:hypothetical protein
MLSKMKTSVVVAALLLAISSAQASDVRSAEKKVSVKVEAMQASLNGLSAVEIPAKASDIVKAASKESQLETAKAVLQQVLAKRPQMAVQMVASILKAAPETASGVTSMAISIVPQFADVIIRAAAISAPGFASEIAVASAQIFPDNKSDVVNVVSLAVPASADKVANAVANAPTRLTSGAAADSHATGGTVTQINHGISHPWPVVAVPAQSGGNAGFDPVRYN